MSKFLGWRKFIECWKDPNYRFIPFITTTDKDKYIDCEYQHIYTLYLFVGKGRRVFLMNVPSNLQFLVFRRMTLREGSYVEVYRTERPDSYIGTLSHSKIK